MQETRTELRAHSKFIRCALHKRSPSVRIAHEEKIHKRQATRISNSLISTRGTKETGSKRRVSLSIRRRLPQSSTIHSASFISLECSCSPVTSGPSLNSSSKGISNSMRALYLSSTLSGPTNKFLFFSCRPSRLSPCSLSSSRPRRPVARDPSLTSTSLGRWLLFDAVG